MTTALTVADPRDLEPNAFAMRPRTMEEAMKFCELMANSDLVPNGYKGKPGNIMVAIQMGQELGMTPMRALRSIAVINGRASMWGDDVLAMVLASPVCEYVREGESTEKEGICKVKRKGGEEHVSRFTLEDAKRAGLLGKQGPWQASTARMLKLRARGFALRDVFADVLAGLVSAEEALDIPPPVEEPAEPITTSLKDRLKAKVAEPAALPEPGLELSANEEPAEAPADDPCSPYRRTLAASEPSNKAIQQWWGTVPEELRQDLYGSYTDALKAAARKK